MTSRSLEANASRDDDRANPMGAYITALGTLIVLISVWLNWVTIGQTAEETDQASPGYEADSIVPWVGFFGISLALALLYATKRADRRQHRGLSLASMAVGLATLLFTIAFLIDPISTRQYGDDNNVTTEYGVWVALIGALIWTIGSFLLAKEPEGEFEPSASVLRTETHARPVTSHERTTVAGTSNVGRTRQTGGATPTDDFGQGNIRDTGSSSGR